MYWKQQQNKEFVEQVVVICFLFSTFDVLETTGFTEPSNTQSITGYIRITKTHVSKQKIPPTKRDFCFRTIQVVDQAY